MDPVAIAYAATPLGCVALGAWLGWWVRGVVDERDELAEEVDRVERVGRKVSRAAGIVSAGADLRARAGRLHTADLSGIGMLLDSLTPPPPSAAEPAPDARPDGVDP